MAATTIGYTLKWLLSDIKNKNNNGYKKTAYLLWHTADMWSWINQRGHRFLAGNRWVLAARSRPSHHSYLSLRRSTARHSPAETPASVWGWDHVRVWEGVWLCEGVWSCICGCMIMYMWVCVGCVIVYMRVCDHVWGCVIMCVRVCTRECVEMSVWEWHVT